MVQPILSRKFMMLVVAGALGISACANKQAAPADGQSGQATPAPAASSPPPAQTTQKPAPTGAPAGPVAQPAATPSTGKVLIITGQSAPGGLAHDVLGSVMVFRRGYGGVGDSYKLLGDKGREVGANAIIDARVWLAPAGFAAAAPHGSGIAIRVRDARRLEEIGRTQGRWE